VVDESSGGNLELVARAPKAVAKVIVLEEASAESAVEEPDFFDSRSLYGKAKAYEHVDFDVFDVSPGEVLSE
jgi:hypothetical protein